MINNNLNIFKAAMVIRFDKSYDQSDIYNRLRGIENVVIVSPKEQPILKRKETEKTGYGYVVMKFISNTLPITTLQKIQHTALNGSEDIKKIDGLMNIYFTKRSIKRV